MPSPKSKIIVICSGQTLEMTATDPSITVSSTGTRILVAEADGKVVSSTIRYFQQRDNVASLQLPADAWIMIQKEG